MKRLVAILSGCLLIIACSHEKIPDDVLQINKMKAVMWDMTMAGEYVQYLKQKDPSKIFDSTRYYTETLKLHNITRAQFYKSYEYYKQHPKLNQVLLDSVNNYANRTQSDVYENLYGKRTYIKRNDSLRNHLHIKDSLLRKKPATK